MMENNESYYPNKHPQYQCDTAKTIRVDCNSASFPGGNAFIPVVLTDAELQALVESEITLPTAAKEIKNMRRNISLTQCKAISSAIPSFGFFFEVKVFVSGVIHKNIQYVEDCNGYLRDYSVDVPFSCNQTFRVRRNPEGFFSHKSTATNERIFIDKNGHGADRYKSGGVTYEFYNEPIECKLLFSLVNDLDLYTEVDENKNFKKIIEKAEVILIFKLIQQQQVCVRLCGLGSAQDLETNMQTQQFDQITQQQMQQIQQILMQQQAQQNTSQNQQAPLLIPQPNQTDVFQPQNVQERIRDILQNLDH